MSNEVTPDNCRDIQEARERQEEANARRYEAAKSRGGTLYAERVVQNDERERQGRIQANERRLDQLEAQNGTGLLGKGKRLTVMHDG